MFGKILEGVVETLKKRQIIPEDEGEIYRYGLESLFIKNLHTLTMVGVGWLMGLLPETLVFLVAYSFIRVYAGGYHANSKGVCYLWSWGTILGVLFIIWVCPKNAILPLALMVLTLGFTVIYSLAPVENPSKPLDALEIKHYGKRARIILILLSILTLILVLGFQSVYGLAIALCIGLEGLMLILGKRKLKTCN